MGHSVKQPKGKENLNRILRIALLTFFLALFFTFLSEYFIVRTESIIISIVFLVFIILIHIIFDIIGIAATAAEEAPFHAKASKKIKGARESYLMVRNADKVANFCNDVIGDITGTIGGALGISLARQVSEIFTGKELLINILITSSIAAITVAGKGLGKKFAISRAEDVLEVAGIIVYKIEKNIKVKIIKDH